MKEKFLRNFLWEISLADQNSSGRKILYRPISRGVTPEIGNLFIPNKIMKPSAPMLSLGNSVRDFKMKEVASVQRRHKL